MEFKSLKIWSQSFLFHVTNLKELLPIFPLLILPFLGDILHAVLIYQIIKEGKISPGKAVIDTLRSFPKHIAIKLYFEGKAFLWAFVPIYGIIKDFEIRLQWAMVSNVLIFEKLSGNKAIDRCKQLVGKIPHGMGVRILITIPAVIMIIFVVIWTVVTSVYQVSYTFYLLIFVIYWISFPLSAVVNTNLYLKIPGD